MGHGAVDVPVADSGVLIKSQYDIGTGPQCLAYTGVQRVCDTRILGRLDHRDTRVGT